MPDIFPSSTEAQSYVCCLLVGSSLFTPVMDSASGLEQLDEVLMSLWIDESVHAQSGKDRNSFLVWNISGLIGDESRA